MADIFKRGRQWWARAQRAGEDIRKPLKTTVERVARKRFAAWLEELDDPDGQSRHTFDEAMLRFVDEHLPRLKAKSQTRYLVSIEALTPHFEGMHLNKIGSAALLEFETARRLAGARIPKKLLGKKRPKAITPGTIRRDLACLSSMFGCAAEWEWVEYNPVPAFMRSRKKRGLRESPPKTRYLTVDEEVKLLAAARGDNITPALHDAICIAIDTGMRREEQFSLTRAQVSADRNQIELTQGTKNSKPREIPLLPRAAKILAQIPAHIRSGHIFTNLETETRFTHLNRGLAGAAKRAGIRPLTWHDLRRTCGCRLLQDHGLSMEEVSRWLGHSSTEVTEKRYAFLETEHLHRAIEPAQKPAQGPRIPSQKGRKPAARRVRGR